VSVVPGNKLLLQDINQLIGIALLTLSFLENFFLSLNFQGESNPSSTPLRTPMVLTYHEFTLFA